MSRTATRFHRDTLTIWPETGRSSSYNDKEYGAPFTVRCNFSTKRQTQVDSNGDEFIPKFTFYVTASVGQINRGDLVALGDHSAEAQPIASAEIAREPKVDQVQRALGTPDITVFV